MKLNYSIFLFLVTSSISAFGFDFFPFSEKSNSNFSFYQMDKSGNFFINGRDVLPGDKIVFETGEFVFFKESLGFGGHSLVFEDDLGRAVRLTREFRRDEVDPSVDGFARSMALINQYLKPEFSVRLLDNQPESENVVFVERIQIQMRLREFLNQDLGGLQAFKYDKLITFLNSFRKFSRLSDFKPYQIGWVKERGWVLFDIGNKVELASSENEQLSARKLLSLWDIFVPEEVYEKLIKDMDRSYHNSLKVASCRSIL